MYTGGSVDDLTLVANDGDFFGPVFNDELRLSFDATAGTTYQIAVAGARHVPQHLDLKLINHAVPGAAVIDGTLFVVGTAKNDTVKVTPVGAADDGSTGVKVKGNYGGQQRTDTLAQPIAAAEFFLTDGHDAAELAGSLAFPVEADLGEREQHLPGRRGDTIVRAGDGNNSVRTGADVDCVFARRRQQRRADRRRRRRSGSGAGTTRSPPGTGTTTCPWTFRSSSAPRSRPGDGGQRHRHRGRRRPRGGLQRRAEHRDHRGRGRLRRHDRGRQRRHPDRGRQRLRGRRRGNNVVFAGAGNDTVVAGR